MMLSLIAVCVIGMRHYAWHSGWLCDALAQRVT